MPVDETLLGGEDYVMNQKIRGLDYKLLYTPDTIVWHYHRQTPKKFFEQIYRYGISRLLIGKKDLKMINPIHITVGFGLPILTGLLILLMSINPFWLIYFASFIFLFVILYFFIAWLKIKSLNAAFWVPPTIIILFSAWSLGFLGELIFPVKS